MEKNNIWNIRTTESKSLTAAGTFHHRLQNAIFDFLLCIVLTIMWPTAHRCIHSWFFLPWSSRLNTCTSFQTVMERILMVLCKQSNHKSLLPLLLFGVEIAVNTNGRIDIKATVTTITREIKTFHQQHLRFSKLQLCTSEWLQAYTQFATDCMTLIQKHIRARLQKLLISYFHVAVGEFCWYAVQYRFSFFSVFHSCCGYGLG